MSESDFEYFETRRGWTIRLRGKRYRDHHGHLESDDKCRAIIREIVNGYLPDDEDDIECCRRILDTEVFNELKPHNHAPHRKERYKNTYCKRCRR